IRFDATDESACRARPRGRSALPVATWGPWLCARGLHWRSVRLERSRLRARIRSGHAGTVDRASARARWSATFCVSDLGDPDRHDWGTPPRHDESDWACVIAAFERRWSRWTVWM